MRLSHTLARTSAVFDDPNLVSHGGLVPVVAPVSGHSGRVLPVAGTRRVLWERQPGRVFHRGLPRAAGGVQHAHHLPRGR